MASEEFGRQVDKVAELLAQRAKRKLGMPRELRLAGAESTPEETESVSKIALQDWVSLAPVDVSDRARVMHEIMRIANAYGWQIAVTQYLIEQRAPYLSDLSDGQLEALLVRMRGYVDAAETCSSFPDFLPAS